MLDKLFGSKVRAKVLSWLLCHPDERFFVRQLESILGEDLASVSRELSRLAGLGILTCERDGREKYYRANTACPVFSELQGVAIKTTGVADAIKMALAAMAPRIQFAFIYGSFAQGEPRLDSDVDLMVVGDVRFGDVVSALQEPQQRLGREINPTVYPHKEFREKVADNHHFITTVLRGPRIVLVGDERELAGLA